MGTRDQEPTEFTRSALNKVNKGPIVDALIKSKMTEEALNAMVTANRKTNVRYIGAKSNCVSNKVDYINLKVLKFFLLVYTRAVGTSRKHANVQ